MMTPYFQRDGVTLYHGDCRDVLPTIEAGDADVLCTDPPFGIGFNKYESHEDCPEEYEALMRDLVRESLRIIGDGPAFVWQGMKNADKWHRWFPAGFRILAACKGFVQFRPTPIQWSWDPVIHFGTAVCDEPRVEKKDWHVQWMAPFGAGRERVNHPCPRPIEQVRYFLCLTECETILDPFAGSGTTLRAAMDLGRKAIGIEISEKYCEIAARRLEQRNIQFAEAM